ACCSPSPSAHRSSRSHEADPAPQGAAVGCRGRRDGRAGRMPPTGARPGPDDHDAASGIDDDVDHDHEHDDDHHHHDAAAVADFSHSEMLRRWWFGDTDGRQFPRYGFLGRLCDVIATPNDAATGVSLGWGPSASLAAQTAVTLSMDPYGDGSFPGYDDAGMNA